MPAGLQGGFLVAAVAAVAVAVTCAGLAGALEPRAPIPPPLPPPPPPPPTPPPPTPPPPENGTAPSPAAEAPRPPGGPAGSMEWERAAKTALVVGAMATAGAAALTTVGLGLWRRWARPTPGDTRPRRVSRAPLMAVVAAPLTPTAVGAGDGAEERTQCAPPRPLPDMRVERAERIRQAWELQSMGTAASAATARTTASDMWQ